MIWMHGTSEQAARTILAAQIRGRSQRGREALAPLPGRTYVTNDLPTALTYALSGLVAWRTGLNLWWNNGRRERGAILFVEFSADALCVPDEDWFGDLPDPMPKKMEKALRARMRGIHDSLPLFVLEDARYEFNWGLHDGEYKLLDYNG